MNRNQRKKIKKNRRKGKAWNFKAGKKRKRGK